MNPVTGPVVIEYGKKVGTKTFMQYEYRRLYSQQPPFNLALPYKRLVSRITSVRNVMPEISTDAMMRDAYTPSTHDNAYVNFNGYGGRFTETNSNEALTIARAKNMCYEKMIAELGERVELLVTLAERREAYSMVEKRLSDLYRFLRALRHPNARQMREFFTGSQLPQTFRETLKFHLRNWRASTRNLGQLWLELHFGWEPIVRDLDTSLQRMASPIPEGHIQVQSRRLPILGSHGLTRSGTPLMRSRSVVSGSVKCYGSVTVRVDNPREVYKTVLGINNPVLTAYSLIPYTWMFDWVNYLGTYISSFTDLAGYKVIRASHSVIVKCVGTFSYEFPRGTIRSNTWSGEYFERFATMPRVTLTWRPLPKRLSVIRGTTLASLLASQLDPKDPIWKDRRQQKILRKLDPNWNPVDEWGFTS